MAFERSSRGVLIADAGIANALLQLVSNPRALCLDRRHSIEKSSDVTGKISVTVFCKVIGESAPAPFNLAACFHKRAFAGFDTAVPFEQLGCYGLSLCADVCGIAARSRAVDADLAGLHAFATNPGTLGGICFNAE